MTSAYRWIDGRRVRAGLRSYRGFRYHIFGTRSPSGVFFSAGIFNRAGVLIAECNHDHPRVLEARGCATAEIELIGATT